MSPTSVSKSSRRRPVPVRGAVLLALALVAAIWSATYFGAEARMRRATARIVRLDEELQRLKVQVYLQYHEEKKGGLVTALID